MTLSNELEDFELILQKKFTCGAENRLKYDNSLKISPKALKFAIFHNKFRVLWKPEDAMKNTVFEITGYETPPYRLDFP